MWQPSQQVEFCFNPPQNLLVRYEKLDPSSCPKVPESCTAEMADQTDVWDEDAGEDDEDKWGGPGGNLVGSDTGKQ